eukprot:INCI19834.1.p1 GENE.INCI19834.1~~INCI19834.1.p1  ORF type:complete len:525 (-),score=78.13 INCI19834.1:225-1799(-)
MPRVLQLHRRRAEPAVVTRRALGENANSVQLAASSTTGSVVNLTGGFSWGYYSAFVEVGTPSQDVLVQLDTGSSLFAVATKSCIIIADSSGKPATCSITLPPNFTSLGPCPATAAFNTSASSTFQRLGEFKANCYGTGSVGFDYEIVTDHVGFEGVSSVLQFGVFAAQFGSFVNAGISGIMGLGRQNETAGNITVRPALTTFLGDTGQADMFTMCLGEASNNVNVTQSTAGYMILGDSNIADKADFAGYTPVLPVLDLAYYNVDLQAIQLYTFSGNVGGTWEVDSIPNSTWIGTIVDSGTTFLTLQADVFPSFRAAVMESGAVKLWGVESGSELYEVQAGVDAELGFVFAGSLTNPDSAIEVKIPVSQLFRDSTLRPSNAPNTVLYYFGVVPTDTRTNVLGDTFMRNLEVEFDRVNSRVGFRPAKCGGGVPSSTPAPTPSPLPSPSTTTHSLPIPGVTEPAWIGVSATLIVIVLVLLGVIISLVVKQNRTKRRAAAGATGAATTGVVTRQVSGHQVSLLRSNEV